MKGLLLWYKVVKKTTVVNSRVFKSPCIAVVNYINILRRPGGLEWSEYELSPVPYRSVAVLGGLVVIVFAIRPKVRGFKPGRGRWIFKGDKNP
jgi:hypothetical protein